LNELNCRMDVVTAHAGIVQAFLPWQQEDLSQEDLAPGAKAPRWLRLAGLYWRWGAFMATTNQPSLIDRAAAAKRSVWVIKPITVPSAPTTTTAWVRPSVNVGRSENAAVSG
jgi:hypothetical protein